MMPIGEKTRVALAWQDLLRHLSGQCHTTRGRERALELPFLQTPEEVQLELDLVTEARSLHDEGKPMPFGRVQDLRVALRRLEKEGMLEAAGLGQVAETLDGGARMRAFLLGRLERVPGLARLGGKLAPLDDIAEPIRNAFDDKGELADDASPDLGRLRRRARELHERVTRRMRGLMEAPQIAKYLQDNFYTVREDRYVLPVRTDAGPAVEGIVHGSSASGQTFFVEPQEVVGLNNELKLAQMEVTREELRILVELSALVREELPAISRNLELLEQLDIIDARARLALKLAAHPPRLAPDGRLRLEQMRHPLMVLADKQVVPNDLELAPDRTLIITGPNAGGKTVCLKTLGLCSLMLRSGMHLPAGPDSMLPAYGAVMTEMGDDQSIEHSLSTFTAHLGNLLDFLERAQPGTLILLDEVGVGTDPREGAALAQALLEAFAASGAQVVTTTHFERLKSLPLADERFVNAAVGFDLEQMQPTYQLHTGVPGSSGALDVARRIGLSPELALRASQLLSGEGEDLAKLLAELAGERTRLGEQQKELQRRTEAARVKEQRLTEQLERLEQQQKKQQREAHEAALGELKQARAELARVRTLLRRDPSKQRLQQADRQVDAAAARVRANEPQKQLRGRAASAEELTPGTRVLVSQLGGEGEVSAPPRGGKVPVLVGGLKTRVPVEGVRILGDHKRARSSARPRPPKPVQPAEAPPAEDAAPLRSRDNTLDLRGMRVDVAIAELERFLDDCLRAEEQAAFVIHGHGTGALRAAVREQLVLLDQTVDRFESAGMRDGGDGVTVVWLR